MTIAIADKKLNFQNILSAMSVLALASCAPYTAQKMQNPVLYLFSLLPQHFYQVKGNALRPARYFTPETTIKTPRRPTC